MSLPGRTRHLFTFSYVGSFFKASSKTSKDADLTTVVGCLELAFAKKHEKFGVKDPSPITLSSRTDSRVHALQNTAHLDYTIEQRYDGNSLRNALNVYFYKRNIPLRISSIQQVSNDFNARKWAKQRSYLYRIGVPKHDLICGNAASILIPISEVNRCHFLSRSNFNVDAAEEVMSLFPGVHNFSSFTGKRGLVDRTPIRYIDSCYIRQGKPLMSGFYEPSSNNFNYWDFVVEGRSFLYRQVRRMVSAAIGVAQGRCRVADVQRALESPTPIQLKLPALVVPAHGLYLIKVTYRKEDLLVNRTNLVHQEHLTLAGLLDQYKLSLKN